MSANASEPIGINFSGQSSGTVNVISNAPVIVDGQITNPNGQYDDRLGGLDLRHAERVDLIREPDADRSRRDRTSIAAVPITIDGGVLNAADHSTNGIYLNLASGATIGMITAGAGADLRQRRHRRRGLAPAREFRQHDHRRQHHARHDRRLDRLRCGRAEDRRAPRSHVGRCADRWRRQCERPRRHRADADDGQSPRRPILSSGADVTLSSPTARSSTPADRPPRRRSTRPRSRRSGTASDSRTGVPRRQSSTTRSSATTTSTGICCATGPSPGTVLSSSPSSVAAYTQQTATALDLTNPTATDVSNYAAYLYTETVDFFNDVAAPGYTPTAGRLLSGPGAPLPGYDAPLLGAGLADERRLHDVQSELQLHAHLRGERGVDE